MYKYIFIKLKQTPVYCEKYTNSRKGFHKYSMNISGNYDYFKFNYNKNIKSTIGKILIA